MCHLSNNFASRFVAPFTVDPRELLASLISRGPALTLMKEPNAPGTCCCPFDELISRGPYRATFPADCLSISPRFLPFIRYHDCISSRGSHLNLSERRSLSKNLDLTQQIINILKHTSGVVKRAISHGAQWDDREPSRSL